MSCLVPATWRRKQLAYSMVGALALIGVEVVAQVDAVQLQLLSQFELPLRWDNVEPGRPYWEQGSAPTWRHQLGFHAVRLEVGQTVTLRIPAGETLRLHGLDQKLPLEVLSVAISNGSGLYLQQKFRPSKDGKDALLTTDDSGVHLVRIGLSAGVSNGLDLAVFISRREPLGIIAPYRHLVTLPGPTRALRRAEDAASQAYWSLAADDVSELELSGPARYAIRARLHYPVNESATLQNWRIEARLDGLPWAVLAFETGAETAQPIWVEGREALVSREKEAYVEIPAGRHRVALSSSAPLFVRLLAQDEADYLLPSLNEPQLSAKAVRADLAATASAKVVDVRSQESLLLRLSSWGQSAASAATVAADRESSPIRVQAAALRLYQDNRVRDSSLLAAAASMQAARRQPDMPALRTEASAMASAHVFFRDLLPLNKPSADSLRFAWYLKSSLNGIGEVNRGTSIDGQHESDLLQSLGSAFFLQLPSPVNEKSMAEAGRSEFAYVLPQRIAPSWVRVLVHARANSKEKIYLQYDGQAPVLLNLSPSPELPVDRFAPSLGEAALGLLAERYGSFGIGTLSAAFSQRHNPAPLIQIRSLDIALPRQVERIRIWREGDDSPVWLALKLQTAKPYAMTERAYLTARDRLQPGQAHEVGALAEFMTALSESPPTEATVSGMEFDSHWQPLARLVRAQARLFGVTIASAPAMPLMAGQSTAMNLEEAIKLGERGQYLPAFELWSKAAASPVAEERMRALYGQIETLRQMGEVFLAEQLLKKELLHGADKPARRRAYAALTDIYRQADDQDGLQSSHAAALVRDPESDRALVVSGLAEALLNNGEPALALAAGLLLAQAEQPLDIMLRAAFAVEWWQVFEDLLKQVPDVERQHFWRAQRAASKGQFDLAEADFRRAGPEGLSFAEHLTKARAISAAQAVQPSAQSLADWATWNAAHPGPRTWQDGAFLVEDFAGTESLYAIDSDMYFNAFRSTPGRPLRLRLAGPTKLRIEARPLHPASSTARVEGWLNIRTDGHHWQTPITQNAAASGLLIMAQPEMLPGQKVVQELQLGPGWHELEVQGDDFPLLLRVQVEQPQWRLPLLPALTADTAMTNSVGIEATEVSAFRRWLGACQSCSLLMNVQSCSLPRYLHIERNLLNANLAGLGSRPAVPSLAVASVVDESALRASDQWHALLGWPADHSDAGLRERLISLVWIAEHQPKHYLTAVALGESIRAAHPQVAGLSALVDRLNRNNAWAPVNIVGSSAGLRSREVEGWEPEAPVLRVRRALLAPIGEGERVLTGENRLVAAFTNIRPARISMSISSADVAGLPPQSLTAMLQIDNQAPQRILLTTERNKDQRTLILPTGRHSLRLWIDAPLANQFLRVQLSEKGRPQFAETVERFYHVATHAEPVRVTLTGPAWVRIDEWIDGRSESGYRWLEKDTQELVLEPRRGLREALYRIHQSTLSMGRTLTPPRTFSPETTPVPMPNVALSEPVLPNLVQLQDGLRLGGQEDGTWSLGLSLQERLYGRDSSALLSGERNAPLPVEKFLEYSATHRYFDEELRTRFQTDILARQREVGSPTLGVKGQSSTSPSGSFWHLNLDGALFMQNAANQASSAWSWALGASATQQRDITPKLWHEPKLALFWRGEQGSSSASYRSGQPDQDIFTPYRAAHRFGTIMGDTLTWRPWLDAQFYVGGHLTSNQDLNPVKSDSVSHTLGWRQLLGAMQWRTQWGGNYFFADGLRATASSNSYLSSELSWEYWARNQERFELGLSFRREIDVDRSLLGLSLIWHFGNGRAYRDFRSAEIDFSDLRQRRVPQHQNNRMSDTP